jgi:transmembrane sensor
LNRVDENMAIDDRTWQEAEAWFSRLLANDCRDREDFERWLHAAPAHAAAWDRTQALWERMDTYVRDEALSDYVREALEPELDPETRGNHFAVDNQVATVFPRRQQPEHRRFGFAHAAAAACVVVAIAVVAVVFGWQGFSPQLYATGDHGSEITLADGSRVHMDIQTRLQVRFGWWHRNVRLLQGRAVFDVAHDGHPFVVHVGDDRVTVLGTRFQIDRRPDSVVVTLMRGSVSVELASNDAQVKMQPGQQVRWQSQTGRWSRADVDTAVETSWTRGFLVFDATPLERAITEINRYSSRKLRLADPGLGKLELSGSFRLGDAASTADALPYVLPVTVHGDGAEIVISHR